MRKPALLISIAIIMLTLACKKEESIQQLQQQSVIPDPGTPSSLPPDTEVSETNTDNTFGFDLFRQLHAEAASGENLFISPTSISLALSMTWNGAAGATRDSMSYALRINHITDSTEINEGNRNLINLLSSDSEAMQVAIANSIWYRQGFTVDSVFLQTNHDYYNAEVRDLDFNDPSSVDTINTWVSEKTNDKIPEIIDRITPDQVMFLINAIYFKGLWELGFDEGSTQEEDFYLANASTKTVSMMHMEEDLLYYEDSLLQACELSYDTGNYSMVLLLPKEEQSTESIIAMLENDSWNTITDSLKEYTVNLKLPRFTFSWEKQLNDELTQMGMGIAFSDGADFTGISTSAPLKIDYVKHKTFIEVNESGTEAAAATVVGAVVTSGPDPSTIRDMHLNRPFLFLIREQTSNTVLFMGLIEKPVEE